MLNYEYQKEAENGNKVAMYNLGNLYYKGEGRIKKNLKVAFYWALHSIDLVIYMKKVKGQKRIRKSLLLVSKGSRKW